MGDNASVMIQFHAKRDDRASLRSRVATAVAMEGVHAHNITVRYEGGLAHADLHLELAGQLTLGEGHEVADRVEKRILHEVPEVRRVDIHLELHDEEPVVAEPLGDEERSRLEARIITAAVPLVGDGALHDLMVARAGSGVYLSCHCYVPRDLSLSEAHRLTDRLERMIRQAVPELDRVAVHAEPSAGDLIARGAVPDPD
jgi:divalent metal cation (Fe/Co/Zn/Cd) transporter